jgi:hypothetical protein
MRRPGWAGNVAGNATAKAAPRTGLAEGYVASAQHSPYGTWVLQSGHLRMAISRDDVMHCRQKLCPAYKCGGGAATWR